MVGKEGAPHILPMYKAAGLQKAKASKQRKNSQSLCISACLVIVPLFLLFLLGMSIYMGAVFLEQVESDLQQQPGILHDSLPNTRNIIQKWSISHLHGVDLTSLGPPPLTKAQNFTHGLYGVTSLYNSSRLGLQQLTSGFGNMNMTHFTSYLRKRNSR